MMKVSPRLRKHTAVAGVVTALLAFAAPASAQFSVFDMTNGWDNAVVALSNNEYQGYANNARVPLPEAELYVNDVDHGDCGPNILGSVAPWYFDSVTNTWGPVPATILDVCISTSMPSWVSREFVFMHEVGHVFDARMTTRQMRNDFRRVNHLHISWHSIADEPYLIAAEEYYADAYSWCAMKHPPRAWTRYIRTGRVSPHAEEIYDFWPDTRRQFNRTCHIFRSSPLKSAKLSPQKLPG